MTYQEFSATLSQLKSGDYRWFLVTFDKPTEVIMNRRGETKTMITLRTAFFESNGIWYFARTGRKGFDCRYYFPVANVASIRIITDEEKYEARKSKMMSMLNKMHPNVWDDIKQEIRDKVADGGKTFMRDSDLKPRNITKLFSSSVIDAIKYAFENKTPYSYHDYKGATKGSKREYSVEMRVCDDGIFRAWFSSEFVGCGNGDYYILINPTTAIFCETD